MTVHKISEKEYYGMIECGVGEGYDYDEAVEAAYYDLKQKYGSHAEFDLPYNEEIVGRLQKICDAREGG